jgi:hypothetical protein
MAKVNAGITITENAASAEIISIQIVPAQKTVVVTVMLPGVGQKQAVLTGVQARNFMQVQVSTVQLRTVLQKAVKAALDQMFSVTSTVPAGGGIDDDFA